VPTPGTNIVVWNEHVHERGGGVPAELYPEGIHGAIAAGLRTAFGENALVRTATLDQPGHGLPDDVLDEADVLVWWGHLAHDRVPDELATRVQQRVLAGMGLVVLHSAHYSKPFRLLMGTSCSLRWREADDRELVWTVSPGHPIAAGVPAVIPLERHEMYGEFFDIPAPDELVFISSFSGGEVFRSGCCFHRGKARVFYFSPGHETYPVYHDPTIQRVIANAVGWSRADASSGVSLGVHESETGWFEQ
jgi:trehalose utilization protein